MTLRNLFKRKSYAIVQVSSLPLPSILVQGSVCGVSLSFLNEITAIPKNGFFLVHVQQVGKQVLRSDRA